MKTSEGPGRPSLPNHSLKTKHLYLISHTTGYRATNFPNSKSDLSVELATHLHAMSMLKIRGVVSTHLDRAGRFLAFGHKDIFSYSFTMMRNTHQRCRYLHRTMAAVLNNCKMWIRQVLVHQT